MRVIVHFRQPVHHKHFYFQRSPAAPTSKPHDHAATGAVLDITITGGTVTPTNAEVHAKVGQPFVMRVNSDIADKLHVHSVPEYTFDVEPRPGQVFEFTVDVQGRVDVELHDLNRTVATIQVRP